MLNEMQEAVPGQQVNANYVVAGSISTHQTVHQKVAIGYPRLAKADLQPAFFMLFKRHIPKLTLCKTVFGETKYAKQELVIILKLALCLELTVRAGKIVIITGRSASKNKAAAALQQLQRFE